MLLKLGVDVPVDEISQSQLYRQLYALVNGKVYKC